LLRTIRTLAVVIVLAGVATPADAGGRAHAIPPGRFGIGDSIMLSVKPDLKALGWVGVNAVVGRPFHDGLAVAQRLVDQGRLSKRVIVGLATNGPLDPADCDTLAQIVGRQRSLFLITTKVPRWWEKSNNDALNACANAHLKVDVIRWWSYSHKHPKWFASDGYHLSAKGQDAYVAYVDAQVGKILGRSPRA
jgi:hypothetical protein